MSDTLKVLGQQAPAGTTETILYTVPTATQTTISSIVVCNRSGSGVTYRAVSYTHLTLPTTSPV